MKKDLLLRGVDDFLSRAITHLGKGHRVDEWGDGRYLDPAIEAADSILRKALWYVGKERRDNFDRIRKS